MAGLVQLLGVLLSLGLMIVIIVIAIKNCVRNPKLTKFDKTIWVLFILFANYIAGSIYLIKYSQTRAHRILGVCMIVLLIVAGIIAIYLK